MAEAKSGQGAARSRPLSPHLLIYRMPINMVMSIVHRITGGALYFGSLLFAWWLIAAAIGPDYFNMVNGLFATLLGKLVLLGYSWALIHHGLGGIRHFIWDTGAAFELERVDHLSWGTLAGSILLTGTLWLYMAGAWLP